MKRDKVPDADATAPSGEQVQWMLAQIDDSRTFRSSPRHRALLRHLVDRSLAGDHAALKETVLAVEVFGRPPDRFDPRSDSIVRVETRRLRHRLADYFRAEGRQAGLRIALPVGSYVPVITSRETSAPPAVSRRARDLVERGEHFLRQPLAREPLEQALARFDEAVLDSPMCAQAHAGRGRALFNLAVAWHRAPGLAAAEALAALQQAVALDDWQAAAHALLGAVQHQFGHDWVAAQRSFRRALDCAPGDAFVHSAYGCHLLWRGLNDEAEESLLHARQLDPQYVNTRRHLVNLRLAQHRLAEARAEIDALNDLAPGNMQVSGLYAVLALRMHDHAAAIRHLEDARAIAPDFAGVLVSLAGVHALAGDTDTALALMAETQRRFGAQAVSPYVTAIYEVRCGRLDAALATLHQALDVNDPNMVMLGTDFSLAPLHAHAGWPALLRRSRTPSGLMIDS